MKNSIAVTLLTIIISVVSTGTAAIASPWAEPGDRQLRRDIEVLSAFGVIDGPVTTWPIPWSQISRGIRGASVELLPGHVQRAFLRVKSRLPKARDYDRTGYQVNALGANDVRTVRGFEGGARGDVDVVASADRHFASSYIRLSVGYRDDSRDGDIQFDGSFLAQAVGNWVVYGGLVDQWWGPGNDSALILSTNARPMPKVGLMRLDPRPFRSKWLSWIGPWQFNMFAARQAGDRNDFAHPIIFGLRLSARPLKGLDIGFTRTMQLCGRDRPCGLGTWKDALVGVGNVENTGTLDEPGNQLAAVDFRYSRGVGSKDFSIYGELMGEDEDNFLIDRLSVMAGASIGGGSRDGQLSWAVRAEFSDTKANRVIGKGVFDGTTYNHGIYTDGYRYRGRSLGASLDSDSRLLTVAGTLTDGADREYWLRYRYADINDIGVAILNPVSASNEKLNIVEGGARLPTRYGLISAELRLADDQVNTPGIKNSSVAFEFGWSKAF